MKNVRLVDIAKATNLSPSAVSKALSNSSDISPETKAKVHETAERMGYHSNSFARLLRSGKNNLIGVIVPNNANPFYSSIVHGIEEKAKENKFTIIISNSGETSEGEAAAIDSMLSIPVGGILAAPVDLANYERLNTNLVLLSRFPYKKIPVPKNLSVNAEDFNFVVNDDFEGQRLATRHLLERGLSDIYILLDSNDANNISTYKTFVRLEGYKNALAEHGVAFDPFKVHFNVRSPDACYHVVKSICAACSGPIGICVTNDYVSLGAYKAVHDYGFCIPGQIHITGYDDVEMSQYLSPSLSSVHSANKELGMYASMHIINLITGTLDAKQRISMVLQPYFVARQSS